MEKQYYAAPMEGMTTWLWRRVHHRIFGGADKYFTPFLSPNATFTFQTKERREIEHNEGLNVVPQLLTAEPEHFIWAARTLRDMGCGEVNLNLGCPSGTVAAKRKGSGLLSWPDQLERLLDGVFDALPDMKISVKTRIGRRCDGEWPALLEIYNRYPLYELIVHPRVGKDMYTGTARRQVFAWTREHTDLPLVYNGDVWTAEDAAAWDVTVMTGRGLIADPALLRRARGGAPASRDELRVFLDELAEGYAAAVGEDAALHRMWELWFYLSRSFAGAEDALKRMRKCRTLPAYRPIAAAVLDGCALAWE
ncbi:MAG: tRNA-dihydrouridine synthase family protein [Oscillospiraceae bacterium]|nr:tRNA-dihydrouridine synthase family protein [Oscillospiraceae bacterium]